MSTLKADTIVASDGSSPVTLTKQSAAKGWYHLNNNYGGSNPSGGTVTVQDSFNVSSITDDGVGHFTMAWTNSFDNALYSIVQQGQYRYDNNIYEYGFMAGILDSPLSSQYSFSWRYYTQTAYDPSKWWAVSHGDLA